jgi:hypothetical protein
LDKINSPTRGEYKSTLLKNLKEKGDERTQNKTRRRRRRKKNELKKKKNKLKLKSVEREKNNESI